MYIKIVKDIQANPDLHTFVFECDEYETTWRRGDEQIGVREDVRYLFWNPDRRVDNFVELWAYLKGEPSQYLLHNATGYVMNDQGSTIDKIYT